MRKIFYNEVNIKPVGKVIIASIDGKIVYLGNDEKEFKSFAIVNNCETVKDKGSNLEAIRQLEEFFAGKRKTFDLKTQFLFGTEFQKKVWNELKNIPYGQTISYKELAENIGHSRAFRAVGSANAKNPLPVIFPCHRVINSNGNPGGYSCSLAVKRFLLDLETIN